MATGVMRIGNLTGGEAAVFSPAAMPVKYSVMLQNCHVSKRGGIAKIPGYVKVNSTDVGVVLSSGYEFRKTDGTVEILVAGGGNIYKVDTSNELTAIKTGLDATAKVRFATMNDICIICNGVDPPMKYDGSTISTLGGSPPATAFKAHVHKGRVWMIERNNKMLATHSALNNPEDYTTSGNAGYIDFKYILKKGDELLDIVTFVDLLVFFFREHIVIYSGTNPTSSGDFKIIQIVEGTGVRATDCVQSVGTDLAFVYDSGVKSLRQVVTTGSLNVKDISELIDPVLRAEIAGAGEFAAVHYPAQGWLMMLIGAKVWLYSYTWKAWARMVDADVNGMFGTVDGKVYLCGTGFLYEYGQGWTFAGTNYKMRWETAWISLSRSGVKMYPNMADITFVPQTQTSVDCYWRYDMGNPAVEFYASIDVAPEGIVYIDSVTDWDSVNPLDEVMYSEVRVPLFGGGRIMQFIFENTSDQPLEIIDIILLEKKGGF